MRHRKHRSRLSRPRGHRIATLRNLADALITHERIETTLTKAKVLRPYVERLVTYGKKGTLHHRRLAVAKLQNNESVKTLFETLAPRFAERPGGYTRIVRSRRRQGDGAEMAYIEFVDYTATHADESVVAEG